MQRQSLGSPSSKLHLASDSLDQKHLNIPTTLSSPANDSDGEINKRAAEADELKKMIGVKKNKKIVVNIESYIHIIPLLTLLCFLILYMSSHDPTHTDMAHFAGITQTLSDPADARDSFTGLQSIVKIKKSDILAIRSLKNLKHRKFAHF